MKTRKLKDWFDYIILGETLYRKTQKYKVEFRDKEILKVLSPMAIKNGMIIDSKIERYVYDNDPLIKKPVSADKFTQKGDIVFKLIEPYSAVFIDGEHTGLVVPSFCVILRGCVADPGKTFKDFPDVLTISSEMNSKFIYSFLNSPAFMEAISKETKIRHEKGKNVTISKAILEKVEVPLFSRIGRQEVIKAYEGLSKTVSLTNKLVELKEEYFLTVYNQFSFDGVDDILDEEQMDMYIDNEAEVVY